MPKKGNYQAISSNTFIVMCVIILVLSLCIVYFIQKDSPSFWSNVLMAIASAALVVVLVSIVDRMVVLREFSYRVDSELNRVLDERITRSSWFTGIVNIYSNLNEVQIGKMISESKITEICILDTYIPDPITVPANMGRALDNGCNFKFLVLDPESDQAKARAALLAKQGLDYDKFREGTKTYMCGIASVAYEKKAYNQIELVKYSEPPVMPIYIFREKDWNKTGSNKRDRLFYGFYLDKASYGSHHLEVARIGELLFEELEAYFDRMYERNKINIVQLEEFLKTSCPIGYKPDNT